MIRQLPPGATPPLILNYSASTVPIIQVALSGEGLTEQNLADIGINQLRTPLVTVPGAAIPYPFGGKQRQVQIDLNPTALQARGLSGQDVANALAAQNLITPVGTQKIGQFEYIIQLNNSPLARWRSSASCRSRPSTARWSMFATSPPCATATRRRPTSFTSTATARS